MTQPLLQLADLNVAFDTERGQLRPVRDVSFSIYPGQTVALVGESGCGKSVTALSILRLIPQPPGRILSGQILLQGRDLLSFPEKQMRSVRGREIAMIFQEPMTSLNPVLTIGDQLTEAILLHNKVNRREAVGIALDAIREVGISSPERRLKQYPHEFSGGMRQRVMIAMALACNPALLIADEPTTALDVTTQAQILELIGTLSQSSRMGILLITHDLGIVAERSDHTCVMYAGRIVEEASTSELFSNPRHPYTLALLASLPQNSEPGRPLNTIAGQAPGLSAPLPGCGFCERCPVARPECRRETPALREISPGHSVRCWL